MILRLRRNPVLRRCAPTRERRVRSDFHLRQNFSLSGAVNKFAHVLGAPLALWNRKPGKVVMVRDIPRLSSSHSFAEAEVAMRGIGPGGHPFGISGIDRDCFENLIMHDRACWSALLWNLVGDTVTPDSCDSRSSSYLLS